MMRRDGMPSFDKELQIKEYVFAVDTLCAQMRWPFAERPTLHRKEDLYRAKSLLVALQRIASQKLPEIRYPKNWKEAFKERWFPSWAKTKWPVKYVVWDVKAMYPLIHIPKENHFIRVQQVEGW